MPLALKLTLVAEPEMKISHAQNPKWSKYLLHFDSQEVIRKYKDIK